MGECSSSRIKLFELSRMLCDESDDPIRVLRTVLAETGTGHGESESSGPAFLLRNFQIQSISGDDWISRVLGPRSAEKLGYIT